MGKKLDFKHFLQKMFRQKTFELFSWKGKTYYIIGTLSKQNGVNIDSVSLYIFLIK